MSIIRDYADSFKTTEWTEAVNEVGNQFGLFNATGLFDVRSTTEKAVVFDLNKQDTTLLPAVSRESKASTTGKDRTTETFSLPLSYFKHNDALFASDILGYRAPGMQDKETVERASAEKVQDMRYAADQTKEYLKAQALKGLIKTPGAAATSMFTEFGISQTTLDFVLGTTTTDVNSKIAELKRLVKAGLKTGTMTGVDVYLDEGAFDRLVGHSTIKSYYLVGDNSSRAYREATEQYMQWGVMDMFEHKGVRFIQYNPTFKLPDGTTEDFLASNTGIAVPRGARGLFRGYNGPSNKLSSVGEPGQEMFLRTYLDPRDEFVDFELEMAPLYFATQPASLIALTM